VAAPPETGGVARQIKVSIGVAAQVTDPGTDAAALRSAARRRGKNGVSG
jgi:hypothetical protein